MSRSSHRLPAFILALAASIPLAGVAGPSALAGTSDAAVTATTPAPPRPRWPVVLPTPLPTIWGCRPGAAVNSCEGSQRTTVLASAQLRPRRVLRVDDPAPGPVPPIDCFYLYPTVTSSLSSNAPRRLDADVRGVLQGQAARFAPACRVFAPVYRQASLVNIMTSVVLGEQGPTRAQNTAYADLLGAWHDYLARDNGGRGVVLVGHSQGSGTLLRLMIHEFDDNAANRAKLVGALLPGSDFAVARGARTGGTLQHIPTCAQPGEFGCVVAYSMFGAQPGRNAYFGRIGPLSTAFGGVVDPAQQVACTNPAMLSGDGARLEPVLRGALPPGVNGLVAAAFWGGRPPLAHTPWVIPGDRFTASCVDQNGANVLRLRAGPGTQMPSAVPAADWGLHAGELSLTLGNLVKIVQLQGAAWAAAHAAP